MICMHQLEGECSNRNKYFLLKIGIGIGIRIGILVGKQEKDSNVVSINRLFM